MTCDCYWCIGNKNHPTFTPHDVYYPIGSWLTVAESLDPKDRIRYKACATCGHVTEESV